MSTRRSFLTTTALAAAGATIASPYAPSPSEIRKPGPADTLRVALIGCRSMGFGDLENAIKQPGVECAALCDIDQEILQRRTDDVAKKQGKAPQQYKDFRKLLEDKTIEAVIIGTPDHWHCLPFLA